MNLGLCLVVLKLVLLCVYLIARLNLHLARLNLHLARVHLHLARLNMDLARLSHHVDLSHHLGVHHVLLHWLTIDGLSWLSIDGLSRLDRIWSCLIVNLTYWSQVLCLRVCNFFILDKVIITKCIISG